MGLPLKIRGIYATALTRFFLDRGMAVSSPSEVTAGRLQESEGLSSRDSGRLQINDLPDNQGVLVEGPPEELRLVIRHLQDAFVDVICRPALDQAVVVEFPCLAKSALDELRNTVVPTVSNHHRLRLIASDYVDLMEKKELVVHPEKREAVGRELEDALVWNTYRHGVKVKIEHVKLDGRILLLSEGEIIGVDPHRREVTLRRGEFRGRTTYDGLAIAKEQGDYAVSAVRGGEWFYGHTYYRRHGELIGKYWNVNTWVEFYPDRIRYVDLEVDVVAWPDGRAAITDADELNERCQKGHITPRLRDVAMSTASQLLSTVGGSREISTASHRP